MCPIFALIKIHNSVFLIKINLKKMHKEVVKFKAADCT